MNPQTPQEYNDRVYAALERLEGKIDAFTQRLVVLETRDRTGEYDGRLRALEEFKARASVYMGAAGIVGGGIVALAMRFVQHP